MSRLPIKSLKNSAISRTIIVLGGGPSMVDDLYKIKTSLGPKSNPILIAINDHPFKIMPPILLDYVVFCDDPRRFPESNLDGYQKQMIGRRVSILPEFCDFHFDGVKKWYDGNSATLAIWLACFLGGDLIVLCGFDLYQGDKVYFHGERTNDKETSKPLSDHLKPFDNCLASCPRSENIRAVSGPLVDLFGAYVAD